MTLRIPDPKTILKAPCAFCGAEPGKRCNRPTAPEKVRLDDPRAWCLDRLDAATRLHSQNDGSFIDSLGKKR